MWNIWRESAFVLAALASLVFLASQRGAVGSTSAASPYAILAPMSAAAAPASEGHPVYKRRASSCASGERDVPTDFGWRCVPEW
jgi:cytochrome c5